VVPFYFRHKMLIIGMSDVVTTVIVLGFLSYLAFLAFLSHINSKNLKNDYLLIEKRSNCCEKKCAESKIMIEDKNTKTKKSICNPVKIEGIGSTLRNNEDK